MMWSYVDDPKAIVRAGYDAVSHAYRGDDDPAGVYAPWIELIEARAMAGSRVLDLGCGCGVPVARRLSEGYSVTGVDFSPGQVERASVLVPRATFLCADMTEVDLPKAHFSAIACLYSIIHLPLIEQPALIQRIAGWLEPGGLVVATVGSDAWTGFDDDWLDVAGARMWWSHTDARTYRRFFENAGLTIEQEAFIPEGDTGHTLFVASK